MKLALVNNACADLQSIVEQLEKRLQPVIAPYPCCPPKEAEKSQEGCLIAGTLRDIEQKIRGAISRLTEIDDQVQL